jgi:hypothetical protein
MNRHACKHWLILGAFGASLLPGCASSNDHRAPVAAVGRPTGAATTPVAAGSPWAVMGGPAAPQSATTATAAATALAGATQAEQASVQVEPVADTGGPKAGLAPPAAGHEEAEVMVSNGSPVPAAQIGFEPGPAPGERATILPPPGAVAEPPARAMAKVIFPRGEPAPARRSFVDTTAAPCFNHAPDYNWIIGQVEYSRISKEWRLRYASVDEPDQYGGHLTLIENHHVSLLHDGLYVHVRGHLVNEDSSGLGKAYYRIESFRGLDSANPVDAEAKPE